MAEVTKIVPYNMHFVDGSGADIEAERRLIVMLMPRPLINSADTVPDEMRYAVAAEPPLSQDEQAEIHSRVERDQELGAALKANPDEGMGLGFIADYGAAQQPHFDKAVKLAEHAAETLGVNAARIIFSKLVPDEELEIYGPEDFDDDSNYHIEPKHYLVTI